MDASVHAWRIVTVAIKVLDYGTVRYQFELVTDYKDAELNSSTCRAICCLRNVPL